MKKVFLALMAVAAIALTGCENKENPSNAVLEYATLCDKLIGLSPEIAKYELDNAGWIAVDEVYIQKEKKSAYEKALKNKTVENMVAMDAMISLGYEGEGESKIIDNCYLQLLRSNLQDTRSAIVALSDNAYNKGVDKDSYQGIVDDTKYSKMDDRASFIQDVKSKDWKKVSEAMIKTPRDGFSIAAEKSEQDGQVYYGVTYAHYLIKQH